METSVFDLLDLPTVVEEYLETYDDGRPEAAIGTELSRRCVTPCLYLSADRAVLVTPLGVRAYTRRAERLLRDGSWADGELDAVC